MSPAAAVVPPCKEVWMDALPPALQHLRPRDRQAHKKQPYNRPLPPTRHSAPATCLPPLCLTLTVPGGANTRQIPPATHQQQQLF